MAYLVIVYQNDTICACGLMLQDGVGVGSWLPNRQQHT